MTPRTDFEPDSGIGPSPPKPSSTSNSASPNAFADNLVRWWEGADSSHCFWLLSGQIEAVMIFAGLSVADLFLYWSRIGPTLDGSE